MPNSQLNKDQVARYSRQLLIPQFGVTGQQKLIQSSVLIVGCGGLGSPCALYLASSGVGHLGLVDYDTVDVSNLHRQILHNTDSIGMKKTESARCTLQALNPSTKITCHSEALDNLVITLQVVSKYDVIVDCSDNVLTRYLLNDAAVILGMKPLVSASALRWEGQLTTYLPFSFDKNSPCYRCLYPEPTPNYAVTNCDTGGILPPVVGVLGSLQAMEVIRILIGHSPNYAGKLLIYDAMIGSFRTTTMRNRQTKCHCINHHLFPLDFDYGTFCQGSSVCDKSISSLKLLTSEERVTWSEYFQMKTSKTTHLIDVRPPDQFDICSLSESSNIPLNQLSKVLQMIPDKEATIFTMCRRGNQSQRAVHVLKSLGYVNVKDIIGGITEYAMQIDHEFPIY